MKESKNIIKYFDFAGGVKKQKQTTIPRNKTKKSTPPKKKQIVDHEGDGNTSCGWCTWIGAQRVRRKTGKIGNQAKNQHHPHNSIVKIGYNIEKNLADLSKLVTQTPVKKILTKVCGKNSHWIK